MDCNSPSTSPARNHASSTISGPAQHVWQPSPFGVLEMDHSHQLQFLAAGDLSPSLPKPLPDNVSSFSSFASLPPELRIKIWLLALPARQRFIKVRLRSRLIMDGLLKRQGDYRPEERQQEGYGIVVHGRRLMNRLLFVSKESRDVVLSHYRVHVPCWMVRGDSSVDTMKHTVLYSRPEDDFFEFSDDDTNQVIDFIHQLKAVHDPQHIGLLNLAVTRNGLSGSGGLCLVDPAGLSPPVKQNFTETLEQLRHVYFVQSQSAGRHVMGLAYGSPDNDFQLNPSFPAAAAVPGFEVLQRDPRFVASGLTRVFIATDPREMVHSWQRLLHNYLGKNMPKNTKHRVLLTCEPPGKSVYSRQDAKDCLRAEAEIWTRESSNLAPERIRDMRPQQPLTNAFGFWLFPVHAFGSVPESLDATGWTEGPRYVDLIKHWPELGLFDLSE